MRTSYDSNVKQSAAISSLIVVPVYHLMLSRSAFSVTDTLAASVVTLTNCSAVQRFDGSTTVGCIMDSYILVLVYRSPCVKCRR